MKKSLSVFFILLVFFSSSYAEEKQVVLNAKSQNINNSGGHYPRTPIHTPEVYIDDYTLIFDTSFEGLSVELLQDDEVVYSDIIDENGEVQLPDNLVGEYELRFCVGSFTFVGEIDL